MTRNMTRYDNVTRNIVIRYDNNMTRNYTLTPIIHFPLRRKRF